MFVCSKCGTWFRLDLSVQIRLCAKLNFFQLRWACPTQLTSFWTTFVSHFPHAPNRWWTQLYIEVCSTGSWCGYNNWFLWSVCFSRLASSDYLIVELKSLSSRCFVRREWCLQLLDNKQQCSRLHLCRLYSKYWWFILLSEWSRSWLFLWFADESKR